jgi:hypothetical protein
MLTRPDASQIDYKATGYTATSPATARDKLADLVHAKEFNILGNGANETAKLQAAFDAAEGRTLVLEPNKTYGFSGGLLVIKPGTTVRTFGSDFVCLNNPTDWVMNIMDSVKMDYLGLQFAGDANTRGVRILGSDVTIDRVSIRATNPQAGQGNVRRRAIRVGTENSPRLTNVKLGIVEVVNFDYGLAAHCTDHLLVNWYGHTGFVQGIWLDDVRHSKISGGDVSGTSASVLGSAGENGILMTCNTLYTHYGLMNVHVENFAVDGSGEHGYRLGGQFVISNVTFHACKSKRPGQGMGVGHGGSGFKILGPTNLASAGAYHQDIRLIDCVVEDVNTTGGTANNFAGFNLGKVHGFSIVNPIVRLSIKNQNTDPTVPPTVSCVNGIEIIGCRYGSITNPIIQAPRDNGIYFFDIVDAGNDWGTRNEWISVIGGAVNAPGENGVFFEIQTMDFRRIKVEDLQVEGGKRHSYLTSTGGSLAVAYVSGHYIPGGSTTQSIEGLGAVRVEMSGGFTGANACADGSTFRDYTNGVLKARLSGSWVTLS